MKRNLLMAVDLGTSFIKVGVYDTQSNCIVQAIEPVQEHCPKPGMYIQHGEEIFQSVVNCIKKASVGLNKEAGDIDAIVFTGQMAGFMGVDKDWNDITSWSCSLDNRYMPYAESMIKEYADLILEESGTNSPVMAPKIKWFQSDYPAEAKKIAKYMMIGSYILGRLGKVPIEEASINTSYIQWTGLADVRNDRWSDKICSALKIDADTLAHIVYANTICGKLSAETAQQCGLKSGIPLVAGAGDKPAGCLGAAIVEPGDAIVEAASYAGTSCCVGSYRPDYKLRRLDIIPSTIPGEFYVHHYLNGSGIALDWYIDNFGAQGMNLSEAFKEMEKKIALIAPGSEGLLAIGHLNGSAMPLDANMRGMWMNFNLTHRNEHFYRALIESYSYEFAANFSRLDELYPEYKIDNVKIIGGGAKSKTWSQINADVCRRRFSILNREDIAMWGASILAGSAVGLFRDMKETARKYVKVCEEFKPDPEMYEKYEKYMRLYSEYVVSLRDYFKKLQSV